MPSLPSMPVLHTLSLYHHRYPVSDHCVHHHIEYGGGQRVPLRHSPESLERRPVVAPCARYHPQPIPVYPEDVAVSRPHAISLQDFQAYVPVQGVIRLVKVQKDHVQDLLPHGR